MRRPSLPTVLSATALFFALTGVGFAAGHYVITSTTQIKPSVLAQLRGRTGERGPKGPTGSRGATGAPGATGSPGAPGSAGAAGVAGGLGNSYFTPFRYPNTLPGDGTPQVVEQLSGLPAGNYLINASADIQSTDDTTVTCIISEATIGLEGDQGTATTTIAPQNGVQAKMTIDPYSVLEVPTGGVVQMQCQSDSQTNPPPAAATTVVANITATQIGTITFPQSVH